MTARFAPVRVLAILAFAGCVASPPLMADETIVMVRHGEKPEQGLGQLNCQGLNRALALPHVIEAKYGRPDAIFAPDPARQKSDRGAKYDYVRPLATIEPTAVYFGMPIDSSIGFKQQDKLIDALLAPRYKDSLIVVAWEHSIIEEAARKMVSDHGGDPSTVPRWESADFDSIYIVRIAQRGGKPVASFTREQEGLNGQPSKCPGS